VTNALTAEGGSPASYQKSSTTAVSRQAEWAGLYRLGVMEDNFALPQEHASCNLATLYF
jgi:hypothetical protein